MNIADRILSVRRQIPDLPQAMPAPIASSWTPGTLATGLPAGTYYGMVTQSNAYGESLPSDESGPLVVAANGTITVTVQVYPGAQTVRVYLTLPGGASGSEVLYTDFAAPPSSAPSSVVVTVFPTGTGAPPYRSTAWLPGTDGPQFSVTTLYQWLNDGLNKLSHAVKGILDYCGVPTLAGQPLYNIPGQWLDISDVWYGGYWVQGGSRAYFYRRNAVTTDVLSNVTISIQSNNQTMEVSYQPDRSSGVTSNTAIINPGDTSVQIADSSVFLLPFGFAQFSEAGKPNEIVAYSSNLNGVLGGLIRGIGNTVSTEYDIDATVTELSLFWCGHRIFDKPYSPVPVFLPNPGTTAPADPVTTTIPVPYGWGPILDMYMLGQAKKAEQDMQGGAALEKQAFDDAQKWYYGNRGVLSRVQVGGGPSTTVFSYVEGAGGIIVP